MIGRIYRSCLILLICVFIAGPVKLSATHLMGGELTYVHDGSTSNGNYYLVKLIVYRYCDSTINPAPLDQSMLLGIYTGTSGSILDWYSTESLNLVNSTFVTAGGNAGCNFTATACIERGEYESYIFLSTSSSGYHLLVERCCRNGNIMNLDDPGSAGMTYYAFIPPGVINSSPQITDVNLPYLCTGDTVSIVNNAYDPDGDSLVYSFVVPYNGYSGPGNPAPDPLVDNNPYLFPIPEIVYAAGYNAISFLGAGSYANIDPVSGLTNYFIPNQGFFVAAIEIREYRNGVLLSAIRRDLQFITIPCTPNTVPNYVPTGSGPVYTVGEGQTLCFDVIFTDVDGDSLFLTASGPLLDTAVVNPAGIIQNAEGDGMVTSQFCWTPVCGTSRPSPYQFFVAVTDNGCPAKTSNEVFSVYVTTGPASQTPSVTIQQTPPGLICQGSQVTFNAVGTNMGTAPQFFWQVNGIPAGNNDPVFTGNNLNNGDLITVTMVSNAICLINDTAYSPPFVAVINPQPAPQVIITSNPSASLCPHQICLFTANVANGGTTPSFQWNLNGIDAGTNNSQFTAANPSGTMTVFVTVTPSTGCPPEISNEIIFNIVPTLVPEVTLTASVMDSVCPGQQVVFNAVAANTGNPAVLSWFINGVATGDTSASLSITSFNDGDQIYVTATSDYECLSPDIAVSDIFTYHIYPPLAGDLTDGPLTICLGEPVNLIMNATGGKSSTYLYGWSVSGLSQASVTLHPVTTGYYFSTVADECYDVIKDSLFIEVLPVPVTGFSWEPFRPSNFLPHVTFTDQSIDAIAWSWSLDEFTQTTVQHPEHDYLVSGFYPVSLITTNQYGCTDTLVRILEVENFITAYMPNSFTPNGDGRNDEFGLIGESTGGYSLRVFNRWGGEVFRSESGYEKWNGKSSDGEILPEGVYIYNFVINNDTSKKPYTGTVTLIR